MTESGGAHCPSTAPQYCGTVYLSQSKRLVSTVTASLWSNMKLVIKDGRRRRPSARPITYITSISKWGAEMWRGARVALGQGSFDLNDWIASQFPGRRRTDLSGDALGVA